MAFDLASAIASAALIIEEMYANTEYFPKYCRILKDGKLNENDCMTRFKSLYSSHYLNIFMILVAQLDVLHPQ